MLGTSSLLASCTERLAIVLRVFESSDRQLKLTLPALSDFGFVVCLIFGFLPLVLTVVQTGCCNQLAEHVSRKCDQRCFMQY